MKRLRLSAGVGAILAVIVSVGVSSSAPVPTPSGVHLAYGEDGATTMTVSWYTPGSKDPGSLVEFGPTADLGSTITGIAKPAPAVPAIFASTLHEATLTGLSPDSTVYYRAGDGTRWTEVRSFRTQEPGDRSFRFVGFADHGTSGQSQRTVDAALAEDPAFVVMAGDLAYANDELEKWDKWADLIQPLAATRALMVTPGNHETDGGTTPTHLAYVDRFALPGAELYYSFDYGNVHFLMLHSTVRAAANEGVLTDMLQFAENDLTAAAARKRAREIDFIFVVQHHPLYGSQEESFPGSYTERQRNSPLIALEEQMLHRHDVDVLLSGHNHHYERTTPIRYGQATTTEKADYVDPEGFVEVIGGGGGAGLYPFDQEPPAAWSVVREMSHHILRFDVDGALLRVTAISTKPADAGRVIDTFTITRT